MGARDDIATTMTGTGLVKVTPYYRQSLRDGDGFVRLASMAQASNRFGLVTTWEVWIVLPQDLKAAEQWLEAKLPALVSAYADEVVVTTVTPAELQLGQGSTTNGVILAGTRAAES